ncbi:MAG: ABC transporter ATP-binding protein [Coleofasciculaceae cyanobacterium RL_1_1]|nr:ABC transporter ATP-binding protein [Coleofasciculaceae cyanobacterium RL_1_1]
MTIEVENLSKTYGTTQAIDSLNFKVEDGQILGLLGPNGAGKTTTMRILSGFLPATSGTARIAGFDVHEQSMAVRQRIGYLPETPPLYPTMTVEGYLHFVARIKGISAGDRAEKVMSAIRRCGLIDRRKSLILKLSKGYRQRVGIAQAIVHDPPAIVLDEPTVGLDPQQVVEVRKLIQSLAGDRTILLSSHILPEVSATCSQVAIVNHGRIVATDSLDNLMTQLTRGGYEIEVGGDISDINGIDAAVQAFLRNVPGVEAVEAITVEDLPEGRYRFQVTIEPGSEPGGAIASAIVESQLNLLEMRRTRASLEDVFIKLTTEDSPIDETAAIVEPASAALNL